MKWRHQLCGLAALALAGCMSIESVAPVVHPGMARAAGTGVGIDTLQQGRNLLANRCVTCHSLEPIAKYPASEWREIVRDMAERSGLSPDEEKKVADYLVAARLSLPES